MPKPTCRSVHTHIFTLRDSYSDKTNPKLTLSLTLALRIVARENVTPRNRISGVSFPLLIFDSHINDSRFLFV